MQLAIERIMDEEFEEGKVYGLVSGLLDFIGLHSPLGKTGSHDGDARKVHLPS